MIWESVYWKEPLLEAASRLREAIGNADLTEEQCAQFERDVFLGFYSVRKLFEATGKVSRSTLERQLPIEWFPKLPSAPLVDWYNRNELWALYDLEDRRKECRDVLYVAHRLVHSFIFVQSLGSESDPDGMFFTSDRDKEMRICFISTIEVVDLFETIGKDYPSGFISWRDPLTGERKWTTS